MIAMLMLVLPTSALPDMKPARCAETATKTAAPSTARTRKLGDEPPASHLYALDRRVAGCPEPIVLREGIGTGTRSPKSSLRAVPRLHDTR
ncbi:hypothetical protein [Sphingomonas sp. RS2018]